MKVYDTLMARREKGRLHMTLLDPDKQSAEDAADIAGMAAGCGTDATMVGGSTGVTQDRLDDTVLAIKRVTRVPVILFPSSAGNLSRHADALYFMSLMNSRDPRLIVGEQRKAAKLIRTWGLETISMAYLVFEPGMRVADVGRAEPLPRDRPEVAVDYAMAAEMFGMRFVYLEAGSGAPAPVPASVVRAVRQAVRIPVIVGGGIRTPDEAAEIAEAGADIVVTGTVVERLRDPTYLTRIIKAVKET